MLFSSELPKRKNRAGWKVMHFSPGPEGLLLGVLGFVPRQQPGHVGAVPHSVQGAEHLVHPNSGSRGPDLPCLPLLLNLGPLTSGHVCVPITRLGTSQGA